MKAVSYVRDFAKTRELPYEQKFALFFDLCEDASSGTFEVVIVAYPEVLGDNYDELVSNLWHASKTGVLIAITGDGVGEANKP